MTIQVKATEQYFFVVLFSMLHEVIVTFDSVDEDHKSKILDPGLFGCHPTCRTIVPGRELSSFATAKEYRCSSMFVAILLCFNLCSLLTYATAHLGIIRETWVSSTNTNRR